MKGENLETISVRQSGAKDEAAKSAAQRKM